MLCCLVRLFPIVSRRDTVYLFKAPAKMIYIIKPGFEGYYRNLFFSA